MNREPPTKNYVKNMSDLLAGPTRDEAHALSRQKPYAREDTLMEDLSALGTGRRRFLAGVAAAGGALAAGALGV